MISSQLLTFVNFKGSVFLVFLVIGDLDGKKDHR